MPPRLMVEIVYNSIFWLNSFPYHDSLHVMINPRTLITILSIDHNKHFRHSFGSNLQVYEYRDNSLKPWTSDEIDLYTSVNNMEDSIF
jgi:hypothetical protein